jgi:hypothetical protein
MRLQRLCVVYSLFTVDVGAHVVLLCCGVSDYTVMLLLVII